MNNTIKHTTNAQEPDSPAESSSKALWANLSESQQEHVNGGWPKIKWPPGNGGGGSNCNTGGGNTSSSPTV